MATTSRVSNCIGRVARIAVGGVALLAIPLAEAQTETLSEVVVSAPRYVPDTNISATKIAIPLIETAVDLGHHPRSDRRAGFPEPAAGGPLYLRCDRGKFRSRRALRLADAARLQSGGVHRRAAGADRLGVERRTRSVDGGLGRGPQGSLGRALRPDPARRPRQHHQPPPAAGPALRGATAVRQLFRPAGRR